MHRTCLTKSLSFLHINLAPRNIVAVQVRGKKHWNQKFRKERAKKVLKIDLPDYDETRREKDLSPAEMKAKLKEKNILPFRPWNEKQLPISCLGSVVDEYLPPEGDHKVSIASTSGVKQAYDSIGKKGKSYLALRKIRGMDYEFDVPTVAEKAMEVYIEAQEALAKNDEDKLHELVTEKAFPEITENVKNCVIKWKFIKAIEPPRIVHIRCQDMIQKDNIFAQITLRLHSQQMLAIYDRFGRLMHGSEDVVKDVLEYVVFEKHFSNPYGSWRIHAKILPDWLPKKDPISKTYIKPDIDSESPESPPEPDVLVPEKQQVVPAS